MKILTSKPALRWAAPLAFVLAVGGTGLIASSAVADKKLPEISAEQLLIDVQNAKTEGLSGTVVQRADLGIPDIPGVGGADSTEFTSLISGTHTMRVRYAGEDKARLALYGTYGETDLFVNGRDVWMWSSKDQTATHRTLPAGSAKGAHKPSDLPADLPKTPEQAAKKALEGITPSTTVSTDSAVTVAGRAAYELVLTPNDDSLITSVRLAVDGDTKLPMRMQAFGQNGKLVFEVGYTDVSFTRPDDREFVFNPPPGTKVTEGKALDKAGKSDKSGKAPTAKERDQAEKKAGKAKDQTTIVGKGWATVAVTKVGNLDAAGGSDQVKSVLGALTPVKGSWGSGRLLAGTAFSVLITDDGRMAVGAVKPESLYRALG